MPAGARQSGRPRNSGCHLQKEEDEGHGDGGAGLRPERRYGAPRFRQDQQGLPGQERSGFQELGSSLSEPALRRKQSCHICEGKNRVVNIRAAKDELSWREFR